MIHIFRLSLNISERAAYGNIFIPTEQNVGDEFRARISTRSPEKIIVGHDDSPEIESVIALSAVYQPTASSAWSPGFLFTVYFKSQPQGTRGVMAKIRPCATPPGTASDRTIMQESCGQVCIISWDAKDESNNYLSEGCYQAEFYGVYTNEFYKSYTSVSYYYADGLGSIRQLTNPSGSILNQYRYGSWGELCIPFIQSGSTHNLYAYTSRESSENNSYYFRSRFYNQMISKFISKDNIGKSAKIGFLHFRHICL